MEPQSPTNMAFVEYKQIRSALQQVLKNRKLTYGSLAKLMKTSEVTIKRLFTEEKYSPRLFEVCEALALSIFDVVEMAKTQKKIHFELTPEQDAFFAENLGYFAIFRELYRKHSVPSIQQRWGLTPPQMNKILVRLEKLQVIEFLGENQVRIVPEGVMELKTHSKLETRLRDELTSPFLQQFAGRFADEALYVNSEIEVGPQTRQQMAEEITALSQRFCTLALRDKTLLPKEELLSVRWLFCFSEFRTQWERFTP